MPRNHAARLAPRPALDYARLWSPVIRPAGEQLVARLPLAKARVVVDLGTGTGNLLPALRRGAGPRATVVGVDASIAMLRASSAHEPVAVMDLHRTALALGSTDVAVMAFVVFQLADAHAALVEARAILRPGGTIGLTSWTKADEPWTDGIWKEELRAVGVEAPLGASPSGELTDSVEKIESLLDRAGFERSNVWTERLERAWDPVRLFECGDKLRFHSAMSALDVATRRLVRRRVRRRIADHGDDGRPEGVVIYAVARRS